MNKPGPGSYNGVLVLLSAYAKTGTNPFPDMGAFFAVNGRIVNTHFTSKDEIIVKKKELAGAYLKEEFKQKINYYAKTVITDNNEIILIYSDPTKNCSEVSPCLGAGLESTTKTNSEVSFI